MTDAQALAQAQALLDQWDKFQTATIGVSPLLLRRLLSLANMGELRGYDLGEVLNTEIS